MLSVIRPQPIETTYKIYNYHTKNLNEDEYKYNIKSYEKLKKLEAFETYINDNFNKIDIDNLKINDKIFIVLHNPRYYIYCFIVVKITNNYIYFKPVDKNINRWLSIPNDNINNISYYYHCIDFNFNNILNDDRLYIYGRYFYIKNDTIKINKNTIKNLLDDILYKYDENINYYDVFDINT
jgi:hypothetical protein